MVDIISTRMAQCLFAAFEVSPSWFPIFYGNMREDTNMIFNITISQTHSRGFGLASAHLLFVVTTSLSNFFLILSIVSARQQQYRFANKP